MAQIKSGASSDLLTVDPTSKASRVTLYDASGNLISPANRTAVAETTGGSMIAGKDYKLSRTTRISSSGGLYVAGDDTVLLYDSMDGTVRSSAVWVETVSGMSSAQSLALGLLLNSASGTSAGNGIVEISQRQFPLPARSSLVFRARMKVVGLTNCFQEWGFSDQSSVSAPVMNNGAFFRRDGAGSLQPILAFNGVEGAGATMTQPASTEYAWYEIFLEDDRATFQITDVNGVLISAQVMERGATGGSGTGVKTQARLFAVSHIPVFFRTYIVGGSSSTTPQINISQCAVYGLDGFAGRPYRDALSGIGFNGLLSPTLFTQLANWSNSGAPTTRTLQNTIQAETTLGGLLRVNSIAGGNTDYIMFGWTNPSPYSFYVDGIWIPVPFNEVIAVATTATIFTYFVAFNSNTMSLATGVPYPPLRLGLPGIHTAAIGLAANSLFTGNAIQISFPTPYAIHPGRIFHICCRELVGTATATETYLWAGVGVTGYFE